ncbi:MAG: site-2 protease family protein [Anaerolineae bacterium]|jgi:Zn-dependent protease|nr:site-2 protease family protein [Anaerolineae bacterium]
MPFGLTADVLLGRILVIFLGIPIHEWAHGWVAHLLGDETPELQGRLSLNPFVHLDPVGTLSILLTGFGWGRAARVNPYRMTRVHNPRTGMALSALAGPVSNIIQAMILAIPFRLGLLTLLESNMAYRLAQVLFAAIAVNIGLAAFNLLPIPPLDGSRVLVGVAPRRIGDVIESLEPYAIYILLFVLFLLPRLGLDLVGLLVRPLQEFLFRILLF